MANDDGRSRFRFDPSKMQLLWGAAAGVVTLLAGVAAILQYAFPRASAPPGPAPAASASVTKLQIGERVTRKQYMTRADFADAMDPMHQAVPLTPGEAAQFGSVVYYTVDIRDSRPYDVKYELWDGDRRPIGPEKQLRGIVPSNAGFDDTQCFWVADDPRVAGIRVVLAPNNPPPMLSDFKVVKNDGTMWQ